MKKVFLSLAAVAVLTVVSCKKADAPAEDAAAVVDSAAAVVDSAAAVVDSAAVVVDSAAAVATEAAATATEAAKKIIRTQILKILKPSAMRDGFFNL